MQHPVKRAFLISAETTERGYIENLAYTAALRRLLGDHELGFKELQGSYHGEPETTFLVVDPRTDDQTREILLCAARWFDQACIIERHTDRSTTTHYIDGPSKPGGRFLPDTPRADEDYTLDPETGEFWVIR